MSAANNNTNYHHHHAAPRVWPAANATPPLAPFTVSTDARMDSHLFSAPSNATANVPPLVKAKLRPAHVMALPTQVHGAVAGDRSTVYVVRRRDLVHVPDTPAYSLDSYRARFVLDLCPAYARDGACARGTACPLAHALIRPSTRHFVPHFAPSSPSAVPAAERYAPELPTTMVASPDGGMLTAVRPHDCYVTRAPMLGNEAAAESESSDTASAAAESLAHCGHWLAKGVCHYGSTCKFVHVLRPDAALVVRARRVAAGDGVPMPQGPGALLSPSVAPRSYPHCHSPYDARPLSRSSAASSASGATEASRRRDSDTSSGASGRGRPAV
eukprot:CAMPEP_0174880112 /NCGR_PEP_ID=MMETSP1114-20130205/83599_1 /TAXON_ID=312471 /ORGANISM="Neobodo designis, Strain CCAP 1951/1" /LENGTH=327 /DNA_ID=CAMNT_0016115507 /DNA_START=272 /DNA_END=1255 /DNA_ORIENTATION=-